MTVGVRNYPRKPLSERERTVREALSRISESSDNHCTFVPAGGGLQSAINGMDPSGGTICLETGDYTGDISITTSHPNITIIGAGVDATILTGSVTIATGNISISNLTVRGNGKAYGVKMQTSGGVARTNLTRMVVGATSPSSGDGPTGPGLWLDGAILTVVDHVVSQSNGGSGVLVNTTVGADSTNVNQFRNCTFNHNARYGIEIIEGGDGVAGMLLQCFIGGNVENNTLGEVFVRAAIGIELRDMDFETGNTISETMDIAANNVIVENCHGVVSGGGAANRFFNINAACSVVRYCRISGNYTNHDVGVFTEDSLHVMAYGNQWWDPLGTAGDKTVTPRWISHRGGSRGYSA